MAVIHIDGFETFDAFHDASLNSDDRSLTITAGAWSEASFLTAATGSGTVGLQKPVSNTAGRTYYLHLNVRRNEVDSGHHIQFQDSANNHHFIFGTSGSAWDIRDGAGTVQAQVLNPPWLINTWYCLELKFTISNTGLVSMRIDGREVITDLAMDTLASSGSTTFSSMEFLSDSSTAAYFWDDLLLCDDQGSRNNSWWNPSAVVALRPNAAGDTTQWNVGYGTNDHDTEIAADAPDMWLKLDETSGTTANDASVGGTNDGTYSGAVTLNLSSTHPDPENIRSGNKYVDFGGGKITVPDGIFDFASSTEEKTITFWAQTTGAYNNDYLTVLWCRNSGDADPLLAIAIRRDSTQNHRFEVRMQDDDAGGVTSFTADSAGWYSDEPTQLWHHYAVTIDSAKVVTLYRDGRLVASGSHSFNTTASFNTCEIGPDATLSSWVSYRGYLDEFMVWDGVALTADRILMHYRKGWKNYQAVDDHFPDPNAGTQAEDRERTVVSDTTTNDIDLYNLESVSPGDLTVSKAIVVSIHATKLAPGTANIAAVIKSNGTTTAGSDQALGTNFRWFYELFDEEPGGAAWTQSKLNALQAGVKVR